jgi:hypothetical protein
MSANFTGMKRRCKNFGTGDALQIGWVRTGFKGDPEIVPAHTGQGDPIPLTLAS